MNVVWLDGGVHSWFVSLGLSYFLRDILILFTFPPLLPWKLITKNLTTNEHIGLSKYAYLRNAFNVMDNPYDRGSVLGNILSGLFPSTKVRICRRFLSSVSGRNSSKTQFDQNIFVLLHHPVVATNTHSRPSVTYFRSINCIYL